jgi:hypothetical protein
MGAAKVLGGLLFLTLGIVFLVIGIVPISILGNISFIGRFMNYMFLDYPTMMMTWDFSPLFLATGYLEIALIIPYVGFHYCKAGIKSMTYSKKKKEYFISETKIGLLIAGFILICVAVVLALMILLQYLEPAFQFLTDLLPAIYFSGLLPTLLIPVVLSLLIIFFVYWLGSKIMKSGIKKEEMLK